MKYIDLHTHSTSSDGTLTPSELVSRGAALGLSAIALTDHDNTDGLVEAEAAAASLPIELVPGIEFSTEYLGTDIHILGLDLDYRDPDFQRQIDFYRTERLRRNRKMIRLMADDGIDISYESMAARFGETVWTRAHFARYLAEHGYVPDMGTAFLTHIGEGCKYYVPRERVSPFPVVELILRFGGIPVLAHPLQYKFPEDTLRTLLEKLRDTGLIGMEVYYSIYSRSQENDLLRLAGDYGLLPSGGSDFHGANKPDICLGTGRGSLRIPYRILEDLRKKKKKGND